MKDLSKLMRAVPSGTMVLFCLSVVLMNLFANKEIHTGVSWIAADCGILVSWLSFLCMDTITKRFGPSAAIKLSIVSAGVNLLACAVFKLISVVPGNWAEYYTFESDIANQALNNTFGGTWYVLMGSTIAFVSSAIVNAILNHGVGKLCKKDNFVAYAMRTYVSTLIGQFVDNLIFAWIVGYHFFGWSAIQCLSCSAIGCILELICEVVFSPIGYRVSKAWERDNVGAEYLEGREA